ncbi:VOC family protein [Spartinivicinus poritis]|uniref:VOC family protein n=1 Tax=Spartinivicinus poritis TaxID=2994640 RepID=A0ABT5U7W2_9GAMM|nr:VOC family protein [Spartinivicinus sp. A2-2]MDE1461503.1 VOC family protein [Spartinivicinus sp. A2-2]
MRFKGICHVEFSVVNYEESIKFYDRMFGWLGYNSFWTMNLGYCSTYYVARYPFPHSYIGIQPAEKGTILNSQEHSTGIHHIALWAKNKKEVNYFHKNFLLKENVTVTDTPAEYPIYAPGYYAVFFTDPTGIRWELAHLPSIPMPWSILKTMKALKQKGKTNITKEMIRSLPSKHDMSKT